MSEIRVLLIAPSMEIVGGQAVQAARLLADLQTQPGLKVTFEPINPSLPPPFDRLQRIKYARTIVTEAVYFVHLFRKCWDYHILHVFSAGYWSFLLSFVPVCVVGKVLKKPVILNYHDGRAEDHFRRFPRSIGWARRAARIVAPSRYLASIFARLQLPTQVIANTIDSATFRYQERAFLRPRFLHNRGFEDHYNVPCTLRAFALVQQNYPEASLVLAHDGPLRASLERLAAHLGLKNVTFTGSVAQPQMAELYEEADVYMMSPDADNMPLSVLEAFASGLPVISTAVGGVPDLVEHGRTGLLVPPNDHEALASAAIRLLEDPMLALRLSREGRAQCERYSGSAIAAEWLSLYQELHSMKRA